MSGRNLIKKRRSAARMKKWRVAVDSDCIDTSFWRHKYRRRTPPIARAVTPQRALNAIVSDLAHRTAALNQKKP